MLEHVVVAGRLEIGESDTPPRSGGRTDALVGEVTGKVLYALRDPQALLGRRIEGPVVVAGTVVGGAHDPPLLEVARVDRKAGPRDQEPPRETPRAAGPVGDGGR